MDRFAAHLVATSVLTAALAALPAAFGESNSAQAQTIATTAHDGAAAPNPGGPMRTAPVAADPGAVPGLGAVGSAGTAGTASTTGTASTAGTASTTGTAGPVFQGPFLPAHPSTCPDARQVGRTAYAYWHGEVAFSVKQFYSPSCHEVYGYAYPWLQFRDLHVDYDIGVGVFDVTHQEIDGARTFIAGAGGPDFWSQPVPATGHTCTQGLAHVFYADDETDTYTGSYCR